MRHNYSRTGASGLIYDGVNLSDTFQIVDVRAYLLPQIKARTQELAQKPGAYFASRQIGPREVKVKLRLDAGTRDPMAIFREWREVSGIFNKSEPKRLQLGEDRWCNAIPIGETEIKFEAYYGVVELTFVCFDPYFYGREHAIAMSDGVAASFRVQGSVPAWPTLELVSSSTSVKVTDVGTGKYVLIPSVTVGTAVTVDMERQVCTKGSSYAPYDLISDFFSLEGDAQVKVEGASGTMRYRERYL